MASIQLSKSYWGYIINVYQHDPPQVSQMSESAPCNATSSQTYSAGQASYNTDFIILLISWL